MKTLTSLLLCWGAVALAPTAAAAPGPVSATSSQAGQPTGEELLQASDRARGAAMEGLGWIIRVETHEGKAPSSVVTYQVKAKGYNALAEAREPARNKGETMLFNDRNLWYFKPGLKKPVSISPRQKLMGQAANGDIASTNYLRDYQSKIVGEETIAGVPAWKLELKAKGKNVTYDGIRYWIAKDKKVGLKAEFLTVSGEVFKTARFTYGNSLTTNGQQFPFVSTMVIDDALRPGHSTTIHYEQPRIENHPDSIFNINNILR